MTEELGHFWQAAVQTVWAWTLRWVEFHRQFCNFENSQCFNNIFSSLHAHSVEISLVKSILGINIRRVALVVEAMAIDRFSFRSDNSIWVETPCSFFILHEKHICSLVGNTTKILVALLTVIHQRCRPTAALCFFWKSTRAIFWQRTEHGNGNTSTHHNGD